MSKKVLPKHDLKLETIKEKIDKFDYIKIKHLYMEKTHKYSQNTDNLEKV